MLGDATDGKRERKKPSLSHPGIRLIKVKNWYKDFASKDKKMTKFEFLRKKIIF